MSVAKIQQWQEIFGFPVKHDPDLEGVAYARGLWPLKWIATGRGFASLTPKEQQAILWHEAWHCLAFHLELRYLLLVVSWLPAVQRLARQQEFDADTFAVKEGYGEGLLRLLSRYHHVRQDAIEMRLSPSVADRIHNVVMLMSQERLHVAALLP